MRNLAKFRERIEIQKPAKKLETSGQKTPEWEFVCIRYAQILPKAAAETIRAEQLRAETTHVVVIPSDIEVQNITPNHRIKWGPRILNIVSNINRDGKEIERELEVKERMKT